MAKFALRDLCLAVVTLRGAQSLPSEDASLLQSTSPLVLEAASMLQLNAKAPATCDAFDCSNEATNTVNKGSGTTCYGECNAASCCKAPTSALEWIVQEPKINTCPDGYKKPSFSQCEQYAKSLGKPFADKAKKSNQRPNGCHTRTTGRRDTVYFNLKPGKPKAKYQVICKLAPAPAPTPTPTPTPVTSTCATYTCPLGYRNNDAEAATSTDLSLETCCQSCNLFGVGACPVDRCVIADGACTAMGKPHIIVILVDDLGWANVGWNRAANGSLQVQKEVVTPKLDELVSEGINLQRHYVHKFCGPSRSAIQSGRAPMHVTVNNNQPDQINLLENIPGYAGKGNLVGQAGIPRNMTGMAAVLKRGGYSTHFYGKWDAGMATPDHTPAGRGYDYSLCFFDKYNDCWTLRAMGSQKCPAFPNQRGEEIKMRDFWEHNASSPDISYPGRPAVGVANGPACDYKRQNPSYQRCMYEDDILESKVLYAIEHHDIATPLFVFWSLRAVHGYFQPPDADFQLFKKREPREDDHFGRTKYATMVKLMDDSIDRVVQALKAKSMYEDTLIVFFSDNGGSMGGGNNFPLKGGKFSDWEGGIRVASFVSGGFLPEKVRGSTQDSLVAGWDWYATFAALAGVDATDEEAAAENLPAHDSINQWPLLSGALKVAPRQRFEISDTVSGNTGPSGETAVSGIIRLPYKLLIGRAEVDSSPGSNWVRYAATTGPHTPNSTSPIRKLDYKGMHQFCGADPESPSDGCLFDITTDPSEQINLAQKQPDRWRKMLLEVVELSAGVFSVDRGAPSPAACVQAQANGKYWGPWIDME